jgi:hypothetical protein
VSPKSQAEATWILRLCQARVLPEEFPEEFQAEFPEDSLAA